MSEAREFVVVVNGSSRSSQEQQYDGVLQGLC